MPTVHLTSVYWIGFRGNDEVLSQAAIEAKDGTQFKTALHVI